MSRKAAAGVSRRVVFLASDLEAVVRGRSDLIAAISARRHQVTVLVPDDGHARDEPGRQALPQGVDVARWSSAPSRRWLAGSSRFEAIAEILADRQPYVVAISDSGGPALIGDGSHGVGLLADGIRAAFKAGVPRIVPYLTTSTALASLQRSVGGRMALGRREMARAIAACSAFVFHSGDSARSARALSIVGDRAEIVVVPGDGVDLALVPLMPLPPLDRGLVVTMLAEHPAAPGLADFQAAAALLSARGVAARLQLVCLTQGGARAPAASGPAAVRTGVDSRPFLAESHVAVCLAREGEELPRCLLEALAAGRPVVTSRLAGFQDAVDERVNGILVEPGDVAGAASAIVSLLKRPDLIAPMARASRAKAERRYDVRAVHGAVIPALGLA